MVASFSFNNSMKKILNILAVTSVLTVASSPCFALQENMDVSKERARTIGVTIRSHPNGEAGLKVWVEFKTEGVLKNFDRVEFEMRAGGKPVVSAPLLASRPAVNTVSAYFSADAHYLATSVLTIVVQDGERNRVGYQFKVKEFVDLRKV